MNVHPNRDERAPSERAPLEWKTVKECVDVASQSVVAVRRAKRQKGGLIYSLQIGVKRDGRIAPFVPVMFDVYSLKATSAGPRFEHDYAAVFARLMNEATLFVSEESAKNHAERQAFLYERDAQRAHGPKVAVTRQEHAAEWRKRQEKRR